MCNCDVSTCEDRPLRHKLTSKVAKFIIDCGFLIRDSRFFSRLSSLLSAPSMAAVTCFHFKRHTHTQKIQHKHLCVGFGRAGRRWRRWRTALLLGSAPHVSSFLQLSGNYLSTATERRRTLPLFH